MSKKRVYIAGPISKGDLVHNVKQSDDAFYELLKHGFTPFNPMWSVFSGTVFRDEKKPAFVYAEANRNGGWTDLTADDWYGIDLPWVAVADAVLRLPGESRGADLECAHARSLVIPVFTSIVDLLEYFK